MFSELGIKDFKCFRDVRLPLAALTVLSGYNGAGKSSALQPLLLAAQSSRLGPWDSSNNFEMPLNGGLIRLGTVGDVLPAEATDMRFEFVTSNASFILHASAKAGERSLTGKSVEGDGAWADLIASLEHLVYLSAVRKGAVEAFPAPDRPGVDVHDVAMDGRFASYWYHHFADNEVEAAKRCPGEPADTFRKQVDAWLGCLAPGASANVVAVPAASAYALQFRLSEIGEWRRPANVGYGLTYAFPIIVALLAAKPGGVVIIDSPEAHLHPRAQSQMGKMLATFAAAGVQVIVETHSDHVLNGVRIAVRDKVIDPGQTSLLFFSGISDAGHGVTTPRLDREGRIDEWPEGFFDQSEKDVAHLAGWV
jgi:predicted ATPase